MAMAFASAHMQRLGGAQEIHSDDAKVQMLILPDANRKNSDFPSPSSELSTAADLEDAEFAELMVEATQAFDKKEIVSPDGVKALGSANKGDKHAIATLKEFLHDANWEVRAAAIKALGRVANKGDNDVLGYITMRLKDPDSIVSYTAWETIGYLEDVEGWGDSNSPRGEH